MFYIYACPGRSSHIQQIYRNLQPQFGAAAPSFKHGGLMPAHIRTITKAVYPALNNAGLCGAVTQFVLSSLIFHQIEIEHWPVDHYV
jgi:hypothetical protein